MYFIDELANVTSRRVQQGQGITGNAEDEVAGMIIDLCVVLYIWLVRFQHFRLVWSLLLMFCGQNSYLCHIVLCSTAKQVVVPDDLVKELAKLRVAFAMLVHSYEDELNDNHEAQAKFVRFLPRLLPRRSYDQGFQSSFNMLIDEEVSLFNVCYLRNICCIFPENVR